MIKTKLIELKLCNDKNWVQNFILMREKFNAIFYKSQFHELLKAEAWIEVFIKQK